MSAAASLVGVVPSGALSEDWAPGAGATVGALPEAVVHPESIAEVAATLAWASEHGVGVLPVASGHRVRSRRLDRPFVVLQLDRLRGVEIYEPSDLTLTAQAGTPLAELQRQLGGQGQWLPFDPPRADERSLGGLVASGESGPVWMGYGELRNHVLGATVVTGDGRTLRLGGRVVKNVAGFDLLKAVVGSRGRLAVITSVCVRAFPQPAEDRLLMRRAASARELCSVARAVCTAPLLPASCVLIESARDLRGGAALLVRLHGATPTVEADQKTLERHCGVGFERPADVAGLLRQARDLAEDGPVAFCLTVLPSRLEVALSAIEDVLGGAELAIDAYLGRLRVAAQGIDIEALRRLRETVEGLHGTLTVRTALGKGGGSEGAEADQPGSRPPADESELVAGIERAFDPEGVFWPCRS